MDLLRELQSALGLLRLKDLIKSVRSCKTAAEERAVIAKESAFIRTQFKEENVDNRATNVAKLLYIHMLGYPAHFGQIECLKLVAQPKFADKRLGYLGIMMLLDENQETLTLVTNCLKNDMNHSNMYIVGLALSTFGNIASPAMARDLGNEIEKLLGSSNSYIRKKAALAALRLVRKVPEQAEYFLTRAKSLVSEKNHAVIMTGVTLLIELCELDTSGETTEDVKQLTPLLVRHLKNLVTGGSSPEHDVGGITDPFLQVKILRLLRILGQDDAQTSEAMNDVLAQVATNTDGSKNVGNAILYETVQTIVNIESESTLRVLAINILGKFLGNRDNNIRYVALSTLTKVYTPTASNPNPSQTDTTALQRHRQVVLECLRDPDISIRRRALDLSFQLVNPQNVRALTRELLHFLELASPDMKASTATRICNVAAAYRPNRRWEIDTVVRILSVSGAHVDQDVINHFIKIVTTCPSDLQAYTTKKLYGIIKNDESKLEQDGLVMAAVWCLGEYGDLIVGNMEFSLDKAETDDEDGNNVGTLTESDVLDLIEKICSSSSTTTETKEYATTALAKLSTRFPSSSARITSLLKRFKTNMDVEIQQRATEYVSLFNLDAGVREALLERIPVLEKAKIEDERKGKGDVGLGVGASVGAANDLLGMDMGLDSAPVASAPKSGGDLLADLLADSTPSVPTKKSDPLVDLLGGMGGMSIETKPAGKPQDLLADIFGNSAAAPVKKSPVVAPSPVQKSGISCYSKNGLDITLDPTRNGEIVTVNIRFQSNQGNLDGLSFQVAVPKTMKLQILPPSSTSIPKGGSATQVVKIANPSKAPIKLRLKIGYSIDGRLTEEVTDFAGFPASLWS